MQLTFSQTHRVFQSEYAQWRNDKRPGSAQSLLSLHSSLAVWQYQPTTPLHFPGDGEQEPAGPQSASRRQPAGTHLWGEVAVPSPHPHACPLGQSSLT